MCQACSPTFDALQSDAFAEQILAHYNSAAITLMISVGHRVGLFDTMAEMPPSPPEAIARAGSYSERYVREWLGAMTTAGITLYDPALGSYTLPEEHAVYLTRRAKPNNIAATAGFIPVLASVEDEIAQCFKQGGGVPYEKYHRFHEVMAEESEQTVVIPLIDSILPLAPEIIRKLNTGARVLDLGCGQGRALIELAGRFPKSEFVGYDLCEETIRVAQANSASLNNVRFAQTDAAGMDEPMSFDVIFTFDSVHDQADPASMLKNIFNALKADGIYLMQDIAGSSKVENNMEHPLAPFLYTISCMHCMSVSLANNGAGLGAMWGEELAEEMVREAGFSQFNKKTLEHDFMNNFYVIHK